MKRMSKFAFFASFGSLLTCLPVRTLQLFDLPSSHEALERSAGLPPSLLQKAEQVRLEDGPAEIEPSIADVHRLAQQDTNILDDEATDVLDNKTPEDEARHLNAMSEAVDGSASAQSSDFSTTATEVSPGVVENMDDPLTARPAKRPGAANNVLAAPPVKRLRLQVIYPVPAGTVPAERPADAPPRATSSSRKRGARSGRSKRSKELDLTLHRGMKEAGTFSGWQALQQLSLREVPPLDSESRNTQLY
ncbi:hypothetical protein B0H13DRAFT_804023 [Mycena leptocephala]|nr:hypothetical protein B0H13DRAFT_804023 [Mycena leptocephala]